MNTKFEGWELPCVNEKCKYNDHMFEQNCAAMIKDAGEPYLPYCQKYIAEGTNCAGASEMNNPKQIDYTDLYRAYYARRARWHSGALMWVAAILVEVIIVLIVGAIVFASIVAISRARVETIPMTGIPSIDAGIYPDAHIEEVKP